MISFEPSNPRYVLAKLARDIIVGGIGVGAAVVFAAVAGTALPAGAALAAVPVALAVWRVTRPTIIAALDSYVGGSMTPVGKE